MTKLNNLELSNIYGGWSLFGKATPYIKNYINKQIMYFRNLITIRF